MFVANLRVATAWVLKQPFYYAIKVLGLAVGIMSCALLIAYVGFVKNYDSHIENRDNIYRVMGEAISRESGEKIMYDFGSNAWIEPFKREYEGLYSSIGVIAEREGVLTYETTAYDQEYAFADREALVLLGVNLIQGDLATALTGPNKIILSESAAIKYFDTSTDVIGKVITLDKKHDLSVSGVYKDIPRESSYPLEAMISLITTERVFSETILRNQLWILFTRHTMLVSFNDASAADFVHQDLRELPYRQSPEQHLPILERNFFALWLQPMSDIYLDPLTGGTDGHDYTRRNTFVGIWILSLLVMLGACVNYISLTIGQLQLRIKELGVRTSFGATKPGLVYQLITESLIVSGPAILLSIQFLYIVVPAFSAVVGVSMSITDVLSIEIWGWLAILILLLCAFVSAGPVIFAGQNSIKGGAIQIPFARFGWRAGSTVIFFQFAISTLSALMVLGIFLQISYLKSVGAGFDARNLIVADMKYQGSDADASGFEAMKNELIQITEVEAISAISVNPPATGSFTNWQWRGEGEPVEHTVSHIQIDPGFLSTYQIPLLAGRNFSQDYPSELFIENEETQQNVGILISESAVNRFGINSPEDAIGQTFRYSMFDDKRTYMVIGVVEDFKFSPMESEVNSIAIMRGTIEPLRNISLKVNDNYDANSIVRIRDVWDRHLPEVPFNLTFMEDLIDNEIKGKTESLGLAVSMASIVFFFTSIIGIYAQASFVCDRSAKSIAVRKVLGSSISAILSMLLVRFTVPVILSFVVALPVAIYFISTFYSSFQQTPGFPVHLYVLCLSGVIFIALVTIFTHCKRAAARHPVHTLRHE